MSSDGDEIASTIASESVAAAHLIDSEITRYATPWRQHRRSAILKFASEVEQRFESGTHATRSHELRLTIIIGLGFYVLLPITDSMFVPDLGTWGVLLRVPAVLVLLIFIVIAPRLSGWQRESFVTFAAILAVLVLATISMISSAPYSGYGLAMSWLALIYANTTLPLRFKYACFLSMVCAVIITTEIVLHAGQISIPWEGMVFQTAVASTCSLIASYRIERNVRLNYLLASKEALRLSSLAADREKLAMLSDTDPLTGLLNRRRFDRESAAIFEHPSNAGKRVALLFMDVDYFKNYNDHYGHPAGDSCLRGVAAAISSALRDSNDLTSRYGGEEFAVLLLDVKRRQAELIAKRVCRAVSAKLIPHVNRDDDVQFVTISVGVATGTIGDQLTIDTLIETADNALYVAKRSGRNRVECRLPKAA